MRMPFGWTFITGTVVVFFFTLLIFISFAQIARTETVRGQIRHSGATSKIFASTPGIISKCHGFDGQIVAQSELLAEIETKKFLIGGSSLSLVETEALAQEIESLETRLNTADKRADTAIKLAEERLQDARSKANELERLLNLLISERDMATLRLEAAAQNFSEGFIVEAEVHNRRETLATIEQRIYATRAEFRSAVSETSIQALTKIQVAEALQVEKADLHQALARAKAQKTRLEADRGYVLRAPTSGKITSYNCRAGEVADVKQPILTIVPSDSALEAELRFPTNTIAFVQKGQPVQLRIDALPYQKFGLFSGRVQSVSETTLSWDEIQEGNPELGPVYRVKVELLETSKTRGDQTVDLQSGMEFTADLILEKRSILRWLIGSVYDK